MIVSTQDKVQGVVRLPRLLDRASPPRPQVQSVQNSSARGAPRWTARVAEQDEGDLPVHHLGGGPHGLSSGGAPSVKLVVNVTCDECRAQMCTDDLLSNLRCAECRQLKFEQFFDAGIKAAIFTVGSVCAWLLLRRLK
jgi:hypothetical protein